MKFNPEIHHRHTIRLQLYDYSSPGGYFITICSQNHECLFGKIQIPVGADLRVSPNICVCPKKHVCPDKHTCPHYNGMGNKSGEHMGSPLPVMILNDAGRMVEKWYNELPNKFPDIKIDKFICMPDHVHFILFNVGADLRVCPNKNVCPDNREFPDKFPNNHKPGGHNETVGHHKTGGHIGPPLRGEHNMGEHAGSPLRGKTIPPAPLHFPWPWISNSVGADLRVCPNTRVCPNMGGCPNMPVCPNNRPKNHKPGEHVGSPLHAIVRWFKTMTTNEYIKGVRQSGWPPFNGKLWQRNYYEHIIRNENELFQIREYVANNPANWEIDPGQHHPRDI